jgi:hypothetical protein
MQRERGGEREGLGETKGGNSREGERVSDSERERDLRMNVCVFKYSQSQESAGKLCEGG